MENSLPNVPISQEQLQALLAAMLVYRLYCRKRTPRTEEREHTLMVLESLLPKLSYGIGPHEDATLLFLTEDDVRVMKGGLRTLIDNLSGRPASHQIKEEIKHLEELKTLIGRNFSTTQD